jgi:hypothetical protein
MRARPNVTPTLLRLDDEARAMLDEYRAATDTTLGAAGSAMIVGFYAAWKTGSNDAASFDGAA